MIIIMLGAQGTGKGTVAGILNKEKGWVQLSTGDIFRENISKGTELGVEANKYISKGCLVPDEITISMVENRLDELKNEEGIILDGFPRNLDQAKKLDEILESKGQKVDWVINLETPREEIIERMMNRRVCSKCKATYNLKLHPSKVPGVCDVCGGELIRRADDSDEEAIKKRLEIYDTQTQPLVDFYKEKGIVIVEEISQRINRFADEACKDFLNRIQG
ncbi:MAG: adenylate kinase [Clostridia bacterium]|nr:adenylate kinase [Clostridia bacterium]